MKTTQHGFAKDFGLVGNNVRRYLQTTALTATGLMAIAAPAAADNWTDHVADVGSISIDTGTPNTTNITQNADFVKVHGDGDINAGWTVNVAQPTSSSKYVLYDVEGDPTHIRGNLNANGEIYIFDQNGVIFGDDAVVNVGSIVTSTGYITDGNIQSGNLVFEGVDAGGDTEVINRGQITVADAGLAAFVAPQVKNAGVIKAKMGKVVLASGKKVTLDLYGDDLVSIAASDALNNALVTNSGKIRAEGGTVVLSAQAAKAAVDNVINMSGVINVSSVSMQGGKIVLSGGKTGTVRVSGKMKAGGTTGGNIDVSGENIKVTNTGRIKTTTGGNINLTATASVDPETTTDAGNILINGIVNAKGGNIALSQTGYFDGDADSLRTTGTGTIALNQNKRGIYGLIQTAIDAVQNTGTGTNTINVGAGYFNEALSIYENNFIMKGAKAGIAGYDLARGTGETIVDPFSPGFHVTGDNVTIDGFTITGTSGLDGEGVWVDSADNVTVSNNIINNTSQNGIRYSLSGGTNHVFGNKVDSTGHNGISVNGTGLFTVENNEIGTDGTIYGNGIAARYITGGVIRANKISNTFQDEPGGNDASGVYVFNSYDVTVGGSDPEDANIIRNADWDGIKVDGGSRNIIIGNDIAHSTRVGIYGTLTSKLQILNNLVRDSNVLGGIGVEFANGVTIQGNTVEETHDNTHRGDGIAVRKTTGAVRIIDNTVGDEDGLTDIEGNGIALYEINDAVVQGNDIFNTKTTVWDGKHASGIYVFQGARNLIGGLGEGERNYIRNADWDGVKVEGGNENTVIGNDIAHSTRVGIYGVSTNNLHILNNLVRDSNITAGIGVEYSNSTNIEGNTVEETHDHGNLADGISVRKTGGTVRIIGNTVGDEDGLTDIEGNGIALYEINDAVVQGNDIFNTKTTVWDGTHASGVYVFQGARNLIGGLGEGERNYIRNADWDGVKVDGGNENTVIGNDIAHSTRVGIYGVATNNLHILNNLVRDSNVTAGIGVEYTNNTNIEGNDVGDSVEDGILANTINGIVRIVGNIVNDSTDDGIEAKNINGDVTISNNTVTNAGFGPIFDGSTGDGIAVDGVSGGFVDISNNSIDPIADNGIYLNDFGNAIIFNNTVDDVGGNGILVTNGDYVNILNNGDALGDGIGIYNAGKNGIFVDHVYASRITSNTIDYSGWDGIHVSNFDNTYIADNTISRSGDDGIEAHDGNAVEINYNTISQSGLGVIIDDEEPVDYSSYDEFYAGADGIHVRNIHGQEVYIEDEEDDYDYEYAKSLYGYWGYAPGIVRITNNNVNVSGDDGIEAVNVEGYVYIADNDVDHSGVGGEGYVYNEADEYGADGIHVRDVYLNPWGYSYELDNHYREGDYGNGEYNVVVAHNEVSNSLDDGIEILGTSGFMQASLLKTSLYEDDYEEEGNHFEGTYGEYEGWYGYPYGSTGRVLVMDNTVTNSGWGSPSEGYGQSDYYYSGGDGIHVQDVYPYGYEYVEVGESESGEFAGYAVDIIHNNVNNSGDDGIDVEYVSSTLIDNNTVINSGWVGDDEELPEEAFAKIIGNGTGADEWGADGIFVNNVGVYDYFEGPVGKSVEGGLYEGGYFTPYSVVIRRNTVENSLDDGIQVNNDLLTYIDTYDERNALLPFIYGYGYGYAAPVLIGGNNEGDGNDVTNSGNHGLYISGPGHTNVIVSGNGFSNFDIGAEFESGLIDLTGATNTFSNGRIGLRFAPYNFGGEEPAFANLNLVDDDGFGSTPYPETPTNFGGTIGQQIFTNIAQFYVDLEEEAFTNEGTPIWLNGLNSTYDGLRPSDTAGVLTQEQFDLLEAKFRHFPDDATTDIFWFGFVPDVVDINQSLIFNRFQAFNGDITGLNVRILGLPNIPGGGNPVNFNGITPAAGGNGGNGGNNPGNLNDITPAAGGNAPDDLNNIETQAGGENDACWSSAMNTAGTGQVVNVVYNGSFADNLNQAAACGGTF